jgi:hypothetical protein
MLKPYLLSWRSHRCQPNRIALIQVDLWGLKKYSSPQVPYWHHMLDRSWTGSQGLHSNLSNFSQWLGGSGEGANTFSCATKSGKRAALVRCTSSKSWATLIIRACSSCTRPRTGSAVIASSIHWLTPYSYRTIICGVSAPSTDGNVSTLKWIYQDEPTFQNSKG